MNSDLALLLACPACRHELVATASALCCANCGAEFPILDGVPVFLPDAAEVVTVPSAHTSNAIGAEFEEILARGDQCVLHLGAGSTATKYPGCIELEHKIFRHTDVVGDAHALPFRDSSFDRVFAFNVFEHLRDPARAAREILRVLKPGGALALHTAFLQPLHEAPRHFFNATEFGVREWFRDFEIEQCAVSGNFSPGFTLGFLAASLLETLRESGAPAEAQSQLAHSRLEQWAALLESKIRAAAGFQRAPHSSAGIPETIGCRFRTSRSQARRLAGAALRLDNPFPLASLSEVENRSWVHVERVEIPTGEVARIEGWVFAEAGAPIERVRAVTPDGTHLAVFPIPRPDVAAAFPNARNAEASGFAIQLRNPPRCRFKLQLESASPNDDWSGFFRTAVATSGETETNRENPRPPGSPPAAELPHPGFYLWFDEPSDWTKLPRRFRLSGWCFCRDNTPIEAIRVRIGAREFPGSYGVFRADVAQMHQENTATFKSGFEIIAEAPRGRATLAVDVRRADGSWTEIFAKKIRAPLINLRPIADAQLWEIGDYTTWIKRYDTLRSSDRSRDPGPYRAIRGDSADLDRNAGL